MKRRIPRRNDWPNATWSTSVDTPRNSAARVCRGRGARVQGSRSCSRLNVHTPKGCYNRRHMNSWPKEVFIRLNSLPPPNKFSYGVSYDVHPSMYALVCIYTSHPYLCISAASPSIDRARKISAVVIHQTVTCLHGGFKSCQDISHLLPALGRAPQSPIYVSDPPPHTSCVWV